MGHDFRIRESANPANRFDSIHLEWEEGLVNPQAMRIHEETAHSILSQNDSPDIPFRFSLNPYRGCAHACAYCYARTTHEFLGLGVGTDFDTQIYAKVNAAELLRKELAAKNWKRETLVFSGVTDCYQPAESRYQLTRKCLEVCAEYQTPVSIITKSSLVLRDLDVLQKIKSRADISVILSVPFARADIAKAMEPFAPSPETRFKAMEKLSAAGIRMGVSLGPIIPGLNDSDIPFLLRRAKESGAAFAFYVMLRLPGAVEKVFLERLQQWLPEKAGKIEHHIRQIREGKMYQSSFDSRMSGSGKMADMVRQLFQLHAKKLGLEQGERLAALELNPTAPWQHGKDKPESGETQKSFVEQMKLGI